jgi:hypothetical protein
MYEDYLTQPEDYDLPLQADKTVCSSCAVRVRQATFNFDKLMIEHDRCHDWTHCTEICCGPCPVCGELYKRGY